MLNFIVVRNKSYYKVRPGQDFIQKSIYAPQKHLATLVHKRQNYITLPFGKARSDVSLTRMSYEHR